MSPIRVGLIGCGGCGVGKHMASYALLSDDVNLHAVYDFDAAKAEAAAKQYNVPHVYNSLEAMLADILQFERQCEQELLRRNCR